MFSIKPEEENCCGIQQKETMECPKCHEKAKSVSGNTLKHILTEEAMIGLTCFDGFYYCKTPTCKVVYFRNTEILTQKEISVVVGLKEGATPSTICYCFGWTKDKIKLELETTASSIAIKDIKTKMENPGCSCEILNPSGRCCLNDVSKAIKDIQKELGL